MRIAFALIGALALNACQTTRPASSQTVMAEPQAAPATPLAPDPAIRRGTLPNGMAYAIQKNATPRGAASIRMRIEVGSTAEAEDQRGLAHFLEHMAFNGSKNVTEGEFVKILERYGLQFGADTNASTGFTETIYKLDLPRAEKTPLDTAFMLMREIAGELTISQEAVDRERGIILSERRARDQFGLRRLIDFLDFALPGTPTATRLPIGTAEVIRGAPAQRLRDLYEQYYRPERTTLVVVGDIDPAAIEAEIKTRFSDWQASGTAGSVPDGQIAAARPAAARYFRDPDVPATVSLFVVKPFAEEPDSVERRERELLASLGDAIVGRRLARIARAADAPILSGSASSGDLFLTADYAAIDVGAKGEDWRGALATGEQELRRALEHGFTQAELAEQLANVRTAYENAARAADTRRSEQLADGIVGALEEERVVITPAERLRLVEAFAPRITVDAVNAVFRASWGGAKPQIHVSGKTALAEPERAILAAYGESAKIAVAAPAAAGEVAFAYTDFGAPGRVVADERIADLDIRTIRFANNVRLNLKKTDFERDRVRASLRIGSGGLEFGKDKPGLSLFMNTAFPSAGLEKHAFDDLQTLLAGRSVSPGLGVGAESFGATTTTTPRDLELQLQVWAAYLTAPGFRAEGDAQWRRAAPVFYETLDASPGAVVGRDLARILADNDPRFGVPALAQLEARNLAELKAAVAPALAGGAIEIALVGDFDEDAAIALVAKTFGALPPRAANPPALEQARVVRFPAARAPVTLRHAGKADEAVALTYWPTTDDQDFALDARLALLAAVMQLELTEELREVLGATYSPGASSGTSSTYTKYGTFGVSANVDVKDVAATEAAVARIAKKLRDAPVSADLLLRARKPILEGIERNKRENAAWLNTIDEAQTDPRWLDRFRQARAVYEAITPAELQALARRFLTEQGALEIRVLPGSAPPAIARP